MKHCTKLHWQTTQCAKLHWQTTQCTKLQWQTQTWWENKRGPLLRMYDVGVQPAWNSLPVYLLECQCQCQCQVPAQYLTNPTQSSPFLFLLLPLGIGASTTIHHFDYSASSGYPGAGIAQRLERDWKVAGSNPCMSSGRIFLSRVDFLCGLLFQYPFHPRVTAVARKRSRSFCQRCRWQVTAKHAYTLRMWLRMKWHGAWSYGVHRTCPETAAVSCGTSHASA